MKTVTDQIRSALFELGDWLVPPILAGVVVFTALLMILGTVADVTRTGFQAAGLVAVTVTIIYARRRLRRLSARDAPTNGIEPRSEEK